MNKKEKMLQQIGFKKPSMMLDLENAVLALESAGYDENTIFAFVNCILKGFIRDGEWAPEYLQYTEQILKQRQNVDISQLQNEQGSIQNNNSPTFTNAKAN